MKKNFALVVFLMLISFSCSNDDELKVETSMLFTFELDNVRKERVNGYLYIFPNRNDYKPETFDITDTKYAIYNMAQIKTQDGKTINSIATVFASAHSSSYDEWRSDVLYDQLWLQPCKPGTYYMIAYFDRGWAMDIKLHAWQSRTVTIKENNGNVQKFVFNLSDIGYIGNK